MTAQRILVEIANLNAVELRGESLCTGNRNASCVYLVYTKEHVHPSLTANMIILVYVLAAHHSRDECRSGCGCYIMVICGGNHAQYIVAMEWQIFVISCGLSLFMYVNVLERFMYIAIHYVELERLPSHRAGI